MTYIDARPLAPGQLCANAFEYRLRVITAGRVGLLTDLNLDVTEATVQMVSVAHRLGVSVVSTEGTTIGSQSLLPFLSNLE